MGERVAPAMVVLEAPSTDDSDEPNGNPGIIRYLPVKHCAEGAAGGRPPLRSVL
jgi:hypothetical protein